MHNGRLSSTEATHLCISDGLNRVDVLPRISDDLLQFRKAYRVVITNELEAQHESIVSTSSRRYVVAIIGTDLVNKQKFILYFYAQIIRLNDQSVLGILLNGPSFHRCVFWMCSVVFYTL